MTSAASRAHALWDAGELDAAADICHAELLKAPQDPNWLCLLGNIYEKAGKQALAYSLFGRAKDVDDSHAFAWMNYGRVAQDMWRWQEGERALLKAVSLYPEPKNKAVALANLAALCSDWGRWKDCEKYAKRALQLDPGCRIATCNLGFAQLAQHNWAEGWKNYRANLEYTTRVRVNYKGEPEWDGTPGQTVVVYGEQGIGDEISFGSMIPDAIRHCRKVIVDCDPRLEGLYKRSFPNARVYGTRRAKATDGLRWAKADSDFDASLAVGQLGEYFRTKQEDFPGRPYLVADPDRVTMWKALFATKRKPVIGIAWRGGVPKSGAKFRQWDLEQLLPLFQSVEAHWVSLQYKPSTREIAAFHVKHPDIDLAEYPFATLSQDYDDTAALVASCDLVICMQTAVAHLAGALGVPAHVFVPKISQWRYAGTSSAIPWYRSLTVHHQRDDDWKSDLLSFSEELSANFGRVQSRAKATA